MPVVPGGVAGSITPVALETNRGNGDEQDTLHPTDHNTLHRFANEASAALGTQPQGGYPTLTDRLGPLGTIDALARVATRKNGAGEVLARRRLNLIEGENVTITLGDDPTDEEVHITFEAAVGTHGSTHTVGQPDALTGAVDANGRVGVRVNSDGQTVLRRRINFREGTGIILDLEDGGDELEESQVLLGVTAFLERAAITTGEETVPRHLVTSLTQLTSGELRLNYFFARRSEVINTLRFRTGSSIPTSSPSLQKVGIYAVDTATGNLAMVGQTHNTPTLFSVANSMRTESLVAPFNKVAGTWYAWGVLAVGATAAMPYMASLPLAVGPMTSWNALGQRQTGRVTGLADLPTTISNGAIAQSGSPLMEMHLLP